MWYSGILKFPLFPQGWKSQLLRPCTSLVSSGGLSSRAPRHFSCSHSYWSSCVRSLMSTRKETPRSRWSNTNNKPREMSPCQGCPMTATDVLQEQLFRAYRMGVVTVYRGMGLIVGYRGRPFWHHTRLILGWMEDGPKMRGSKWFSKEWVYRGSIVCECDEAGMYARQFVDQCLEWSCGP